MANLESFSLPLSALLIGASRGIGLGLVRHLIEDPKVALLFAACRHPASAPELSRLADANVQRLRVVSMDVTDEPSVAEAAAEIANEAPRLDLLINCAGVLHDNGARF
ncbi:MAG: SDR family NAD(P)-dependent oxidoreductase [Gammaproteobacteria bacterium]|nr:SDR family NAD(P)-dependent oxidoreductase [Gammaproteobacteria bacterium]